MQRDLAEIREAASGMRKAREIDERLARPATPGK
jgi:hypothetical protein